MKNIYNENSFGDGSGSLRLAKVIMPVMLDLLQPKSVVDVGCGTGALLSVFHEHGLDILGIDGDWISKDRLHIPQNFFQIEDLEKPVLIGRTFDLAISLEVAEHLPESSAEIFIQTLTDLAPVVLFSAAIPYQGGLNHVNEQWPEYWVKLFAKKDYVSIDCIRKKIWGKDVGWWYKQNTFLFVKKEKLAANNKLQKELEQTEELPLSIVHPKLYLRNAEDKSIINSIKWLSGKLKKIKKAINNNAPK